MPDYAGMSFSDDGRLVQVTAGIKVPSSKSSLKRLPDETRAREQEIISTPL